MHLHYLQTRQELGFNCLKDIHAIKQLVDLKNILGIPLVWIVTKGKKTFILIFSKEFLVALLIFTEPISISDNIQEYIADSEFSQPVVCQISKSNTFYSTYSNSTILNSIMELKGGSDDLPLKNDNKLIKSILSKVSKTSSQEISLNKFLTKVAYQIEPIVTNQKLWRILSELEKPVKSATWNNIQSTNVVRPIALNLNKTTEFPNDFESRLEQEQLLNARDSKLLRAQTKVKRDVNRFLPSGKIKSKIDLPII